MGGLLGSMREVLRGNVLVLTAGTVIRQLSLFITFPYFSLYVLALGGSKVDIGIVNSLRPLAAMFVYPIAGALAGSYSRVKTLVIVGLVNSAIIGIYMLAPDWRFLAVASFINGLLVFQFPASSALLADSLDPGLRGRGFAAVTSLPAFAGILSPFVGGYLIETLGLVHAMRLLYAVTLIALTLITVINWRFLKETLPEPHGSRSDLPRIVGGAYRETWETLRWLPRELKVYALILIVSLFFNALTGPFWVVYAGDILGLRELDWGTLLTLATVIQVALAIPAGSLIDRVEKRRVAAAALALSALPVLAYPYSGGFAGALLVFVPVAVANAFLIPAAGALMIDLCPPDRRGMVMACLGRGMMLINYRGGIGGGPGMGFILTLPVIIGSFLGGYIYDAFQAAPWLLLGAALAVNALLAAFLLKPSRLDE
ncbi:MAG: MFS transporter [Candidatus Bathyarchaeota archaeon]|nr:MAG: MFS transporter [Candidatus Bathyarchaeota archaeon]